MDQHPLHRLDDNPTPIDERLCVMMSFHDYFPSNSLNAVHKWNLLRNTPQSDHPFKYEIHARRRNNYCLWKRGKIVRQATKYSGSILESTMPIFQANS